MRAVVDSLIPPPSHAPQLTLMPTKPESDDRLAQASSAALAAA